MKEIIINVKGIECQGCEKRIQNLIGDIDGVESVVASHESGTVKIVLNKDIDINMIKDEINDLGFSCEE